MSDHQDKATLAAPDTNEIVAAYNAAHRALHGEYGGQYQAGFQTLWNRNFGIPATPDSPDDFTSALKQVARNLFERAGAYSDAMKPIHEHPAEAAAFMTRAHALFDPYFEARIRKDTLLLVRHIRAFLTEPDSTPTAQIEKLRKYYTNFRPSPFEAYKIDWSQTADELVARIDRELEPVQNQLQALETQDIGFIPEEFLEGIRSFWSFLNEDEKHAPAFAALEEAEDKEFFYLSALLGFEGDSYWCVKIESPSEADWNDGSQDNDNAIYLGRDHDPSEIAGKVTRSVLGLKEMFKKSRLVTEHRFWNDAQVAVYTAISDRIESEVARWLPELIQEFFPEVWTELEQGQHPELQELLNPRISTPTAQAPRFEP